MPFTRISISRESFDDQRQAVSEILQQCLETHFDVPPGDCFQMFEAYSPQQKVFDNDYPNLSKARSNAGLLFHIFAGKPRNHSQKRAFFQALCQNLEQKIAVRPEDVMVIIQFNDAEDWSFSSGLSMKDMMIGDMQ
ncbi:tautomerase family protein [Celerinatantimonas yamalensis]|uniref:Tautomerase family protein n=1 Tax=Celerinatantimonas yamalensis TaxID=559956 RepID=A0ABW9G6C7_9GAMM